LTDSGDVAKATKQIAVYALCMKHWLERQRRGDAAPSSTGALVLAKPNGMDCVAKTQSIERDMSMAHSFAELCKPTLDKVSAILGEGQALDNIQALMKLPACYTGKCRNFCAMHKACHNEAQAQQNPALLGVDAEELFGSAGCTLDRAWALFEGRQEAVNPEEIALVKKMRVLNEKLKEAQANV
jgi:hypothetical protein